jgi:hypothetical protein
VGVAGPSDIRWGARPAAGKTEAARLTAALVDQSGTTVKPGKQEILAIADGHGQRHETVDRMFADWSATEGKAENICSF